MKTAITLLLGVISIALIGCAGITPTVKDANIAADSSMANAAKILDDGRARHNATATTRRAFTLGATALSTPVTAVSRLTSMPVTFNETYQNLNEVIGSLTNNLGVSVRLNRELVTNANLPITLNTEGSLYSVLNTIANHYGIYWAEENGGISFFVTTTRTFSIAALGDAITNVVSVSGEQGASNSGGGSGGGSSASTGEQRATFSASNLSAFKAMEDVIKTSMLSSVGKVVATPSAGSITVTDTPDKVARIAGYIDAQNKLFSKQIMLEFKVYSVTKTSGDTLGFDWAAVFRAASTRYGMQLTAPSSASPTAASLAYKVLPGANSSYTGSEAIARAMQEYATVTEITSTTLSSLNYKPMQYRDGENRSYIASTSSTSTTVGITNSTQTAVLKLGFSVNIIPAAQENGDVLMQISISRISLLNLERIVQGQGATSSTIQTPNTNENSLIQQIKSKSGETIVLAGFDQNNNDGKQQGIGFASNLLFGSETGNAKQRLLVFTLTPVVID